MLCGLIVALLIVLASAYIAPRHMRALNVRYLSTTSPLFAVPNNDPKQQRKIVRYDNVGDPIYEDEANTEGGNGINVLGINLSLDPVSLSLLVFGLIAFNFFVLANL